MQSKKKKTKSKTRKIKFNKIKVIFIHYYKTLFIYYGPSKIANMQYLFIV